MIRRAPDASLSLALLSLGAIVISAFFTPETLPKIQVCTFYRMTGRPCPGCGLTRAFCAISHGRFQAAWDFNPFGFIFYAAALLLIAWPLLVRLFPGLQGWSERTRLAWIGTPILVVTMLVFGVLRAIYT